MYDAVIYSQSDPTAAARTLATLVEGVVEGMLGRVIVVSGSKNEDFVSLADAAGCTLLEASKPSDISALLGDYLTSGHTLVFKAGALLPPGWPSMLRAEVHKSGHPHSHEGFAFRPPDILALLANWVTRLVRRRMRLDHGALVPRDWVLHAGYSGDTIGAVGRTRSFRIVVERAL